MEQKDFLKCIEDTLTQCRSVLAGKGAEYAGSEDRLANFKRGANLTGATPLQVAFIYASKHYDSIASFVAKTARKEPVTLSEPIEGRLTDLINYCLLMRAIIQEARSHEN